MYGYGNQQPQYGGFQQQQPQQQQQQQPGFMNNWSTQPQQPQAQAQQQQQFSPYGGGLQTQPTGYGFGTQIPQQQPQQQQPLATQTTGWNLQAQQQQQPLASQGTGWNTQPQASAQPLASQGTGWNTTSFGQAAQQQPAGSWNTGAATTGTTAGVPLTSQRTGFQPTTTFGQQLQAQVTGWQPPAQQQQQPQPVQQQIAPVAAAPVQAAPQPILAQPTGFSSAVKSMQSQENHELKIPQIRLSFITVNDQTKFEHLFRMNVKKGENAIDGQAAKKILTQSGLSATQLADIWALCDTNKSGQLLFPEFALALHLCNLAIKGESVPLELPTKMKNEVSSFVDVISFGVADTNGSSSASNVPDNTPFSAEARQQQQQQLQPQPTNAQLLSGLIAGQPPAPTGGFSLQPQRTGTFVPLTAQQTSGLIPVQKTGGFGAPPMTSFTAQKTGGNMPSTGYPGMAPQATGLLPQTTGLMPQATGLMPQATGLMPQATGLAPQPTGLTAMPTGKPGQWGFVSMPTGGLSGLDMMQSHFMPNANTQVQQLQTAIGGGLGEVDL
ncbi:unnamed protein product [Ambrosiozyma monospora]|uniref:Unnamed protein product n=1 Tax=Ambrosiozyma monospora TaxID=43982 RepID=A0ACB5SZQ1_AMBMO|nr:unnamed protein product [Ambrosiozyma monospora]